MTKDIKTYINRCLATMEMCCVNDLHSNIVSGAKSALRDSVLKQYAGKSVDCSGNKELLKDMKLAKEFQDFIPDLPFEKWGDNDGVALVNISENMFEDLACKMGFIMVDCHQHHISTGTDFDRALMILNGTADWDCNGEVFDNFSAGNMMYCPAGKNLSVQANHTPMLAFYICA